MAILPLTNAVHLSASLVITKFMFIFWGYFTEQVWEDKADIFDEAITFFRANVFFKNFHVKSPADKLLIYLTSYINIALKRLESCRTLAVGTKAIINLGLENVPVPGEPGFPFPGLFTLPFRDDVVYCSNWVMRY
ncbi:Actin-related protein 2/3 complex subunit 3 [Triticum urartu]|uniref:Actin-related protein 2/3 complex subunit 3 n=1 Tax=Triticum urartu TaxID=4572 RepID=M7ZM56_TRIUA|nr:Actin-related protein 2/3 complex subunit 3 [Triticum urartu]